MEQSGRPGDYSHGDKNILSRTKGNIPIQIGPSEAGFDKSEITLKVNETKEIIANNGEEFNLIYLNKNGAENFTYTSLNTGIAGIDQTAHVTGNKIGTTRVQAKSKLDQKIYSILVKVIDEAGEVAPKIAGGENIAVVLKADGNLYAFGYNGDGRLGTGDFETKDIPSKISDGIIFKDIKVGKDYIIALSEDGEIYENGKTKIEGIGSVEKIASRKRH